HQPHVVGVAAEVVARLLTGVAAGDRARLRDERVPDGRAAAVDRRAALDLVRRGGRTPAETGRERKSVPRRARAAGSGHRRHRAHLTPCPAPCMIPVTMRRASSTKITSTGSTPSVAPVSISA